jgi:hypothetical protein
MKKARDTSKCVLRTNRIRLPNEQTFHHNVYVILLENAVAKHPSILRINPKRDPLKPCVYVGMIGLPVDHRFENHKNSYKSAWVVKKIRGSNYARALRTPKSHAV